MSPAFGEESELGSHFRLRGMEPVTGVHHRTVVVENDSCETGAAQSVAERRKRFAPAGEFARGGEVTWVGACFPGNRGGLPWREAWQSHDPLGAREGQVIELAAELGHTGPSRIDSPADPGPARDPQRREQRSQRRGVRTTFERDPRLGDAHGKQIERTLCQRTIRVGDEGEHGARLTPLGEPMMSTVNEVAVVGELKVAERRLREI